MSRLRIPALLSLLALVGPSLACNTPPKEAHDGASAPPASASASASASSSASPSASASSSASASASACTKDDDCRLYSSYCAEAPCACRALSPRDPNPSCLGDAGSKVRCFVDPCMSKAARCQSGACVLTAK